MPSTLTNGLPRFSESQYADLARALSTALANFLGSSNSEPQARFPGTPAANDNDPEIDPGFDPATRGMTLKQVQRELHLGEKQIILLRRLWGFPTPVHHQGHLTFSRARVEAWVRVQPDPDNLAAVLRLRRRRLPRA